MRSVPAIQDAVKRCCAEDLIEEELEMACQYLAGTYMKIRSRDYVRQIMSMSRRSLNQGTRARMAVLAEQPRGGKTKKQGESFESGHVASTFSWRLWGHSLWCLDRL